MGSKFHLSLNVRNLRETAAFLETLLGVPPAQLHRDYAKFELDDPAIVLSLAPTDVPTGAGLNHVGFRLSDAAAVAALEQRLSIAGVAYEREQNVACCHSRQTKFWVHDPAGNLWELYALIDECDADAIGEPVAITPLATSDAKTAASKTAPQTKIWSHRLGQSFPDVIPAVEHSLDEIILEGTFNTNPQRLPLEQALAAAARALRAGGKILLHGLTADRPLSHAPRLPGPAAAVEHVPTTNEVLSAVRAAGFVGLELLTFGETYRFEHAGAELREMRLVAWRADSVCDAANVSHDRAVIYRGPFAELRDDSGLIFRRGKPTTVDAATWIRLQESGVADQFVFLLEPAVAH